MSVIYYYYYLFYKKILKDSEPHMLATMALSANQAIPVIVLIEIGLIKTMCLSLEIYQMLLFIPVFLFMNYWIYHRSDYASEIVKTKPKFFDNHKLSIAATIVFFICTLSFIIWGGPLTGAMLEQCK